MANVASKWIGRGAGWLLIRAPKRAATYTFQSNLALASDLGRRWIVFTVFGAYLWGMRWLAVNIVPPLRTVSAVLLLLWFWHGLNLFKWSIHARAMAARERAMRREQFEILQEMRTDVRKAVSAAANRLPGGSFTVPGMMRHHDPTADEHARMAREQATESRSWLPEEQRDMPLGDKFEPLISWPGFLRRRRGKQ